MASVEGIQFNQLPWCLSCDLMGLLEIETPMCGVHTFSIYVSRVGGNMGRLMHLKNAENTVEFLIRIFARGS